VAASLATRLVQAQQINLHQVNRPNVGSAALGRIASTVAVVPPVMKLAGAMLGNGTTVERVAVAMVSKRICDTSHMCIRK
jgi:hypothetical protein